MKKKYFFISLFSVILLSGCQDYLEEEPLTDVSIEFLYSTPEGLEAGVVGLYDTYRGLYTIWPNENAKSLLLNVSHDLVVGRSGYISVISHFDKAFYSTHGYGPDNFLAKIWQIHYQIIDRANAIITATEKLDDIDEERRNTIIGEAKMHRAHSLFILWKMFNNVYITTEPTTPENVFDRVQQPSSLEEIFTRLHSDFDFAIQHLEWKTELGRMTKALAHHLKAKAALWEEDWQTAADNADSVINSGYYHLMSSPSQVFAGDRNHEETLYAMQLDQDKSGGGPGNLIPFNFQASYHRVEGCKLSLEQGGRGAGFIYPNDYLLGLYEDHDLRLNSYYRLKYYYNDEPNLPEGVSLGDQVIIDRETDESLYYLQIAPSCQKFFDDDIPANSVVSYKNIILYRLAETHLVAAEAYMKLGNQSKAFEMISPLQERAGVEPIFNVTEIELLKEQARELAFEGQRWFFLKRTGQLVFQVQRFNGNDGYRDEGRGNIRDHMVNFPIPQSELDLLGKNYPQNDGY